MKIILMISALLTFNSFSGTGMGSPSFVQELEAFDYQMAFPAIWKVSNQEASGSEGLFRQWEASNAPIVGVPDETVIKVDFLDRFPATNLSDLYAVIKQRHPNYMFTTSANVSISGWTSDLIENDDQFKNWEYYFIRSNQVVRIQTIRKRKGYGVSHAEIILRSIRKISDGIKVKSIEFTNESGALNAISAGDKVCYKLKFDYPLELQEESMITSFRLNYEKSNSDDPIERKVNKERKFDPATGTHSICYEVSNGMQGSEHLLDEMGYEIDGTGVPKFCEYTSGKLKCGNHQLALAAHPIVSPGGDRDGPAVENISFDSTQKTLKIKISDQSDISLVQIYAVTSGNSGQARIGLIFPDEIVNGEMSFKIKANLAPSSFINTIYFTDTAGNTSALIREREGALNYSFKQLRQAPVQTNFSIIGF